MQSRIEENKEEDNNVKADVKKENDNHMNVDQAVSSIRNLDGGGQGDDRIYF